MSEICRQIATLLAVRHETSASALTWALYALTRAPEALARLCAAVRVAAAEAEAEVGMAGASPDDTDTAAQNATAHAYADTAAGCTYLAWVVRDALRLHALVTSTMRICARDVDAIPLAPGASVRVPGCARTGAGRTSFTAPGDIVSIPIQGPDAAVFKLVSGLSGFFWIWFLEFSQRRAHP